MKNHTLRDRGESWEKDFDSEFPNFRSRTSPRLEYFHTEVNATQIKNFISSLRSDLLQQVIEGLPSKDIPKVGSENSEVYEAYSSGFNEALNLVTSLLNKMRDE